VIEIAGELGVTPSQVGLAWLLAHAPTTLLIPGTKSVAHLEENIGVSDVTLSADALARLDAITAPGTSAMPDGVEGFLEQD
jgi:pyridoxine 4-dehydrogenase